MRLAQAAGCRFVARRPACSGQVDTDVDTDQLALHMLDQGWLLAPGALFRQPAAQHLHAHQLRHHAGRGILAGVRARARDALAGSGAAQARPPA